MAVRIIEFQVNEEGTTPSTLTWGGVQGEDNATALRYVLSENLLNKIGENFSVRIMFSSICGGIDPTESLQYNGFVERTIPKRFTQHAGKMASTLIISKIKEDGTTVEFMSIPTKIFFTPNKNEDKKIIENLSAYEKYLIGLIDAIDEKIEHLPIDEAVKNALTNPGCQWSEEDKKRVRELIKAKKESVMVVDNQEVNYYTDTVISNESLVLGQEYTWSYYCSEYPGWMVDDVNGCPVSNRNNMVTVARMYNVRGKDYVGIGAKCFSWASGMGENNIIIYQDGNDIKVYKEFGGDNDVLTIER